MNLIVDLRLLCRRNSKLDVAFGAILVVWYLGVGTEIAGIRLSWTLWRWVSLWGSGSVHQ